MGRALSLYAALIAVWLPLSGFFDPYFLGLAVLCCALVVFIAQRMDVIDHEGHPIHLTWRFLTYLPWLAWQIVHDNIVVARWIWHRELPIDPQMRWVPASQESDVGTVIYANSITLTPGTISVSVERGRIMVHALSPDLIGSLEDGEMDARVRAVEG